MKIWRERRRGVEKMRRGGETNIKSREKGSQIIRRGSENI